MAVLDKGAWFPLQKYHGNWVKTMNNTKVKQLGKAIKFKQT